MEDDASQVIRFKLDPIPKEYFSKPIRLIPFDDTLSLRLDTALAVTKAPPVAPRILSLAYPFVRSPVESIGAEASVEKAVFDSTRLRQPLLDICRMYEEMIN